MKSHKLLTDIKFIAQAISKVATVVTYAVPGRIYRLIHLVTVVYEPEIFIIASFIYHPASKGFYHIRIHGIGATPCQRATPGAQ
jgi:hypothetical protein